MLISFYFLWSSAPLKVFVCNNSSFVCEEALRVYIVNAYFVYVSCPLVLD